jgi:hypothetical protein
MSQMGTRFPLCCLRLVHLQPALVFSGPFSGVDSRPCLSSLSFLCSVVPLFLIRPLYAAFSLVTPGFHGLCAGGLFTTSEILLFGFLEFATGKTANTP